MIPRNPTRRTKCLVCIAAISVAVLTALADEPNYLAKIKQLGMPALGGDIPAYYSPGHHEHAEQLQSAIRDMNKFFHARLGVRVNVVLALLESKGWTDVTRISTDSLGSLQLPHL